MSQIGPSLLVFCLLLVATGLGLYAKSKLHERHRTGESVELIQLAITLQVTFTAIVLGLLTSSVKTGFETAYQDRGLYAGQLAQLDRCLRDFGPETGADSLPSALLCRRRHRFHLAQRKAARDRRLS